MKEKNNPLNLIKFLGDLIKYKKFSKKYSRPKKHQPSWMYRNE